MSRRRTLAAAMLAVTAITAPGMIETPTKLIWNASASAPVGFYTIEPAEGIEVPELVAVMPPEPLAAFMVERGYVGRGVPLLKRVAGLPGNGFAAPAARSRLTGSRWPRRWSATASAARCLSGRAAAPSLPAKSSS